MANVTDHLVKIQELTQTNLSILQALNDALYTKQNHLAVNVGEKTYTIPSFMSLENKINSLQENFEHLVNAPASGEAYFNFDGNSRAIEVRSYTHTPNSVVLKNISSFGAENNNIFKDFLTPNPFINLSLETLPNDITTVMVKKVVPIHEDLIALFKSQLTDKSSAQYRYSDLYKILSSYENGADYIEYDTKSDLPVRENIGNGLYAIQQILEDIVDEDLDEYITIKIRNDISDDSYSNKLSYKLFNETIERPLKVGDQLITFDNSAKMEITEVRNTTNVVVVKVLHGEYLNLVESTQNDPSKIHNLSKLRFYSPVDFDKDKYIKVSLEEDEYVFVAVAALNNRMNVQAPWGSGLIINAHKLIYDGNLKDSFKTYYDENVRNVGDVLYEITSMMSNTLTKYTGDQFKAFAEIKPTINEENLLVTQINKHLNNSTTITNIRALYSQKKDYENKLNEINNQITSINQKLSEISFDDTSNIRSAYTDQLAHLASEQSKLNTSIMKVVNDIAYAANNSEVPIENAKYRIRGFFDCNEFIKETGLTELDNHIRGIKVQYRYKNVDQEQGTAISINGKFIFSDWIDMKTIDLQRVPYFVDGYKYKLEGDNSNINEPSFNQIDIPITQGETVDIRLKVVYDLGWPFVYTTSDWSEIINIKFPDEYLKDVQILDIIKENNDDIETNRFNNIISSSGILSHVNDKVTDQDITYYHKPEDIASGFYTDERRIIPLKDKLFSMNNILTELYDTIYNTENKNLSVSIINGDITNTIQPYITNNISVSSYDAFGSVAVGEIEEIAEGNYIYDTETDLVTTLLNIKITNDSNHTMKLYSLFPGSRDTRIKDLKHIKSGIYQNEYVNMTEDGEVYGWYESEKNGEIVSTAVPQYANQFITFRMKDVNNNDDFYAAADNYCSPYISSNADYINYESSIKKDGDLNENINCAFMYPIYTSEKFLCLDSDNIGSYKALAPGEYITLPIAFEYRIKSDGTNKEGNPITVICKTMSFDIRTSLYQDPVTYTFKVTAKAISSSQDKIISAGNKLLTKYNILYK